MTITMNLPIHHPTAGELARYVVQTDEPDASDREVRRHLESGCEFCIVAVGRLLELAQENAGPELTPADRPRWVIPPRRAAPRMDAGGPPLAGFRIACNAGEFDLDLLGRECAAPAQLRIVGQITRAGHVYLPVGELTIRLVDAASRELVTVQTDEFGEFDLAAPIDETVGLVLGAAPGSPCVLVWDGEPR